MGLYNIYIAYDYKTIMQSFLYNENSEEEFDQALIEDDTLDEMESEFGRRKNEDEMDNWGYDDEYEDLGFN